MLPQVSWDNPHLFGNALAKELREFDFENGTLLQYVDDLLLSNLTKQDSDINLNFLEKRGYKVSPMKAQISGQQVQYLASVSSGFLIMA